MAKLIKIDRNGSKHYEGPVTCDRCGGDGIYKWGAVINGRPQYAGTCFKCLGAGKVIDTWIERTPEYQAKLDAKREAKRAAQRAAWEAEEAKREAERQAREAEMAARKAAREAEEAARKARSQYVGEEGQRLTVEATYEGSPSFEVRNPYGMTETRYIHRFRADGNLLVWKTGTFPFTAEEGQTVTITGTVKAHEEYRDEKQTILLRCKITRKEETA